MNQFLSSSVCKSSGTFNKCTVKKELLKEHVLPLFYEPMTGSMSVKKTTGGGKKDMPQSEFRIIWLFGN